MNCAPPPKPPLSDLPIRHEVTDTKGRYLIDHPDGGTSELAYSILSAQTVIADHTAVAEGHNGQGIGLALLTALMNDARDNGFRIVPLCPFVNAQRRRHPEWNPLFQI